MLSVEIIFFSIFMKGYSINCEHIVLAACTNEMWWIIFASLGKTAIPNVNQETLSQHIKSSESLKKYEYCPIFFSIYPVVIFFDYWLAH